MREQVISYVRSRGIWVVLGVFLASAMLVLAPASRATAAPRGDEPTTSTADATALLLDTQLNVGAFQGATTPVVDVSGYRSIRVVVSVLGGADHEIFASIVHPSLPDGAITLDTMTSDGQNPAMQHTRVYEVPGRGFTVSLASRATFNTAWIQIYGRR